MNKGIIIRLAIVVVLSVLLLWGGARGGVGPNTEIQRTGETNEGQFGDAPLSDNQSRLEREMPEMTSATEQEKAVIFPTHSSWVNDAGNYEVIGEVENVGKATGRNVRTRIVFKSPSWFTRLAVVETPIDRRTLEPGEKSSFSARYPGDANHVGGYVLMTVTDPPTTGFREFEQEEFGGLTTGTVVGLELYDASQSPDTTVSVTPASGGLAGPDWRILLLLITGSVWGAFRFNQWR